MFVHPERSVKKRRVKKSSIGECLSSMLIAALIVFCLVLFVLAFLAPRLSRHFQRAGEKPLELGGWAGGKAPGKLGEWLRKPFSKGERAVEKSGAKGREGRAKSPF
jgi:Family of unknown function (DUF6411)